MFINKLNVADNFLCDPMHLFSSFRLLNQTYSSVQTVLMDQVRFQDMQQEADQLVLLSSLLLIVYTTTGEAISGLPGLMDSLKATISVMLADMHMP